MSDPGNIYHYNTEDGFPTLSHTAVFAVFFGLFTVAHIIQAGWKKQWWLYATLVIFGLMEVIGWAGERSKLSSACFDIVIQLDAQIQEQVISFKLLFWLLHRASSLRSYTMI